MPVTVLTFTSTVKHLPLFLICHLLFGFLLSLHRKENEVAIDIIIEQLRKHFGKRQSFSRQELYDFYTEFKKLQIEKTPKVEMTLRFML